MQHLQHIIVLMLENRSFDHMLGYLDHPDPNFPRLTGLESNPNVPGSPDVTVSNNAAETLRVGPQHSHAAMVKHMYGVDLGDQPFDYNQPISNKGFVQEYEDFVSQEEGDSGHGAQVMKCFKPKKIPVLATLAKEFAVCTRWFCSVPGQTWPNRCFVHAGTSEGQVDIKLRNYKAKTLFELLTEHDVSWGVFHDGLSHLMVYGALLDDAHRFNFSNISDLKGVIKRDELPAYTFIEPDHFGGDSTSQHPGNNTDSKGKRDFLEAEKLIAKIYNALRNNPTVFNKTLFVITYDESGGFFDHEIPPAVIAPDEIVYNKTGFRFNVLGPRVPAVLVSPWIPKHTIDQNLYDHTAVIRSVCEQFLPAGTYLKARDRYAQSFLHNLSLPAPRANLPTVVPREDYDQTDQSADVDNEKLDDMQNGLIDVGFGVEARLNQVDSTTAPAPSNLQDIAKAQRRLCNSNSKLIKKAREIVARFQKAGRELVE